MAIRSGSGHPLVVATSWFALLLESVCLAYIAWTIPADRRGFAKVFEDFDMELPSATIFMLQIPSFVIWGGAALLMGTSIALQLRLREKGPAALFHLTVVALSYAALTGYRECLLQPLLHLIESLQ